MSKSNYAGLDYSGPGSTANRDVATGIRYGVISQNSIQPDVMSDIWMEARDLSYEAAVEEQKNVLKNILSTDEDDAELIKSQALFAHLKDFVHAGCNRSSMKS
jgi:hypothetical protein